MLTDRALSTRGK
uniref:Uncharacterized protein n=1 Tax=Rhizophora mucronata TaxID=61149 RepID=A0A2P2PGV5_RHIMU